VGQTFVNSISKTISSFSSFFLEEARREAPLEAIGGTGLGRISRLIGFLIGNLIRVTMIVGTLASYLKKGKDSKTLNIQNHFRFLSILMAIVLVLFIVLPQVSISYNLDRMYMTVFIFLAPFFPLGIYFFLRTLRLTNSPSSSSKTYKVVISIILILQLAYASGFLNQLVEAPQYISLNPWEDIGQFQRYYYFFDQDVTAASWVSSYVPAQGFLYYDITSSHIFRAYTDIADTRAYKWKQWYFVNMTWRSESYIYFRVDNVLNREMYTSVNSTTAYYKEIGYMWPELARQNIVYSTGGTNVYQVLPR
jgi:uncharacterized membrane protein